MATDSHGQFAIRSDQSRSDPGERFEAIGPNDNAELAYTTRGIYVGVGGDIVVQDVNGTVVQFKNVPTGAILPIRAVKVFATAPGSPTLTTTATNLIGLS